MFTHNIINLSHLSMSGDTKCARIYQIHKRVAIIRSVGRLRGTSRRLCNIFKFQPILGMQLSSNTTFKQGRCCSSVYDLCQQNAHALFQIVKIIQLYFSTVHSVLYYNDYKTGLRVFTISGG